MTVGLKIIPIGDSLGFILPPEIVEKLALKAGESLYLDETAKGYEFIGHGPEVRHQLEIAERVMREDYNLLRKLAEHDTRPHPDLPQA